MFDMPAKRAIIFQYFYETSGQIRILRMAENLLSGDMRHFGDFGVARYVQQSRQIDKLGGRYKANIALLRAVVANFGAADIRIGVAAPKQRNNRNARGGHERL